MKLRTYRVSLNRGPDGLPGYWADVSGGSPTDAALNALGPVLRLGFRPAAAWVELDRSRARPDGKPGVWLEVRFGYSSVGGSESGTVHAWEESCRN